MYQGKHTTRVSNYLLLKYRENEIFTSNSCFHVNLIYLLAGITNLLLVDIQKHA